MAEVKRISLEDFKGLVKARVTEGQSLRKVAPTLNVSAMTLSFLLRNRSARPGPRLLRALGYRAVTVYEKVVK